MDGDDRALPERFERQMAYLREQPDVITLSCFAHYINPAGRRVARAFHDLTSREAFARYMAADRLIGLLHPGAFIRRDALIEAGGYRREYEPAEDIDLWNRLSERGPVLVLPEFLMEYRLHPGSVVANSLRLAHLKREWVEASMRARRCGQDEPSWEQFESSWRSAPVWRRIDRGRRLLGDRLFRVARQELAGGTPVSGLMKLCAAAVLRPAYSAPRFRRRESRVTPGAVLPR